MPNAGVRAMADPKKGFVETLFAEHGRALHAYFFRRIRTKSDAADLTQEVYLRLLRVNNAEAVRNPVVYLYTVASNLVKEHAVLDRRNASLLDIDEENVQEQLGTLPSLESELDANQLTARMRSVLDQMPHNWRTAVILQLRYGYSYQEIADHLGVSPNMVKKYLAQAFGRCRRRMTRWE